MRAERTAGEMRRLKRLGERVAAARGKMSLRDAAAKAGLSPTTLHHIEHGRVDPQVTTLDRVARALGVTAAELLA